MYDYILFNIKFGVIVVNNVYNKQIKTNNFVENGTYIIYIILE